ncbi:MAG: sulfur carrier protein ThiS [Rhodanobacter sp.]|nr:MAG: sulfur carrier protein ThiS [Rhodanobacter sp.]TAL88750.1 MAG: sulfur carrier protein ThiS [Rhodanobacter sp.]TAM39446.1 MAG: sulfur carrier protein ThiS [Rhodanobacter sp.]TAN26925.1 MAG: sulfur carrier protein ThiS [Rhodanobacter sp.]
MHILVNGVAREVHATTMAQALDVLDYQQAIVATALNGVFVPTHRRDTTVLKEDDALEILAPMQGG